MKATTGEDLFDERYARLYGDRWPALRSAMAAESAGMAWERGLTRAYRLDPASVLAALSLPAIEEGDCIDLCAAPGGKSLVLLSRLGGRARLCCNERSRERFGRLRRVLEGHLEPSRAASIDCTSFDAATLCRKRPCAYDRVLLDAPCSSERHVLSSPSHLSRWSPARVRNLSQAQWALLSSAFLMLKEGGYLAYSTCSISPEENDGVADRLFSKYGNQAIQADPVASISAALSSLADDSLARRLGELLAKAEIGSRGIVFMPDACDGAGPMYVSLFRKRPSSMFEKE